MQTKLTLRLDGELIGGAKRYAAESGTSVSQLVADYFALIAARDAAREVEMTPRVRGLLGALAGCPVDEADHRRYIEAKYR